MILPRPCAPFERLDIRGVPITIDVSAKRIVIPTDNQLILPSYNQWTESATRCNFTETPCGGLKNSIVQDKCPGSLIIEGDGCYLQNLDGTYTGKSIGAGKLSETTDIKDTGNTGIALATSNGIKIKMMDGNFILLRPPSCIVEEFKIINISNVSVTYTITVQCPDLVDSIELYNLNSSHSESVTFTKVGNSYTFSRTLSYNSSENLQITIKYRSLESTSEFTNDANTVMGLQNMSKAWIALIPENGYDIDIFSFTERPSELSYKQKIDGTISQITLYSGNGSINHSQITYPNHTIISGSGTIPDCLNANIEGSVTKFLQSYGMKTDFSSDATITTWIVPAITDEKLLPLSTISDDYLGDEITIRMCPGEYGCASFVLQSDSNINLEIVTSDLVCGKTVIPKENIDIKYVKCWYQAGYGNTDLWPRGVFITPELLLNDDSLIISQEPFWYENKTNPNGNNYLKLNDGSYIDVSKPATISTPNNIQDTTTLSPLNLPSNFNKQIWLTIHIPENAIDGYYVGVINITQNNTIIKSISINITVLPFSLSPSTIEYSVYYRAKLASNTNLISPLHKSITQFTEDMKNILSHGVTNPSIYGQDLLTDVQTILSVRQQLGLDNSHIFYHGLNITSKTSDFETILSLAENYGVSAIYVYGLDESDLSTYQTQIATAHNMGVKVYCSQSVTQAQTIASVLDIAVISETPDISTADMYHNPLGKYDSTSHKVYSYANPQSVTEYPNTFRLNYGFLLWQYYYDGAMDFAYQYASPDNDTRNIWNDFDDLVWRDHCFTYPTLTGPINTVQWEGYREASNDMKYLTTLQNAIADAKNRDVVTTDIDNWLTALRTTDLTNVNLDDIRSQMIDYILQLQSSENYSAVLMENGKAILFKNGTQLFLEG